MPSPQRRERSKWDGDDQRKDHAQSNQPGRDTEFRQDLPQNVAAADHGGDPRGQGGVDLVRADEVNVRVNPTGREDFALPGNDVVGHTDGDGHTVHGFRVAGFADAVNVRVTNG